MVQRSMFARAVTVITTLALGACGSDPEVNEPCDPLVPEVCAFPFPNDFFTREDDGSPTGLRVDLREGFFGTTAPEDYNRSDGWSTGHTILFQLAGGTDEGFPTPTNAGMELSLTAESKTIVLDAETGERIPHFAEEDRNALDPENRALTIRPVVPLKNARRYIVAVRGVVDGGGELVPASEGFVALRDGTSSNDRAITSRRKKFNGIFAALEAAGVERAELQLAWDFTTGSVENTTAWLLHMRDEGLELVRQAGHPYTITRVESADCDALQGDFECVELSGGWTDHILHYVTGTFRVPNYMTAQQPGGRLIFGDDGLPEVNADAPWHDQPFHLLIPSSAASEPKSLLQYGHGLFGSSTQITSGHFRSFIDDYGYTFFGTTLDGMGEADSVWTGVALATSSDLSKITPMFDRLHQGMMQQILLMDTIVEGFSADPDFGAYLDTEKRDYHGISQGGIMGSVYAAISPHIERAALGVMGQPYSLLLFRSVDFTPFFAFMRTQIPDPRGWQLAISLVQMLWDRVEPNGYSHLLLPDARLPGSTVKNVLMRSAPGDHQVSQIGAHIMARAMNAKALTTGVREDGLFEIEYAGSTSETEHFIAEYDFGNPIDPPCNLPPAYRPENGAPEGVCNDPHGELRSLESARQQLDHFLRTGAGVNFCPDGEGIDPAGECRFPTDLSPASAECGMTSDGLYAEDDDLSLRICGLL